MPATNQAGARTWRPFKGERPDPLSSCREGASTPDKVMTPNDHGDGMAA